ncbi:MAG: hypothetical protein WA484_14085 [Solirubrobacteraceae bacterium]
MRATALGATVLQGAVLEAALLPEAALRRAVFWTAGSQILCSAVAEDSTVVEVSPARVEEAAERRACDAHAE